MEDEREVVANEEREATAADDVEAHSLISDDKGLVISGDEDEERRLLPDGN